MGALILILIIGGLFAVLIVPRQREVRRHQQLVASVAVGDEIMTGSGLYGSIVELDDDFVHLEIAPDVVVKLARRAVLAKVEPGAESAETDEGTIDVIDPEPSTDAPDADAMPPSTSMPRRPSTTRLGRRSAEPWPAPATVGPGA